MDVLVTRREEVAWGAAVIAGTRVPVDTLFEYLERGRTLEDFLAEFVAAWAATLILASSSIASAF